MHRRDADSDAVSICGSPGSGVHIEDENREARHEANPAARCARRAARSSPSRTRRRFVPTAPGARSALRARWRSMSSRYSNPLMTRKATPSAAVAAGEVERAPGARRMAARRECHREAARNENGGVSPRHKRCQSRSPPPRRPASCSAREKLKARKSPPTASRCIRKSHMPNEAASRCSARQLFPRLAIGAARATASRPRSGSWPPTAARRSAQPCGPRMASMVRLAASAIHAGVVVVVRLEDDHGLVEIVLGR